MVFENAKGKAILIKMVQSIQQNKTYLGDIDGLIGDGDHGSNMNKGFTVFKNRICDADIRFSDGLDELGAILLNEIGGSMGPIYGSVFMGMGEAGNGYDDIGLAEFANMMHAGMDALSEIIEAKVGDKTLVDTLQPAIDSLDTALREGKSFVDALCLLKTAAKDGSDSTKDMVAKYGRSSRLGERSRGVLDAGSVSCYLIFSAMADGITELLR